VRVVRGVEVVHTLTCRKSLSYPEFLWLQAAAELRSAWAAEGGRPYTSSSRLAEAKSY
jgi:hypothetical protein